MIKIHISSIILLILCSCGINESPSTFIDPSIQPFLDEFRIEADNHKVSNEGLSSIRNIYFRDNTINDEYGKESGECKFFKTEKTFAWVDLGQAIYYREISIDRKAWNVASYDWKRRIIFHELGHCVYSLTDDFKDSNQIMYEFIVDSSAGDDSVWKSMLDSYFIEAQENKIHWNDNNL